MPDDINELDKWLRSDQQPNHKVPHNFQWRMLQLVKSIDFRLQRIEAPKDDPVDKIEVPEV